MVLRAVDRDATAFADLYDRHVVRVYRHIYYLVNDATTAEDLTAQTFLKAWEAIDRYKERGAPIVAWLLRIAHNVTIDAHRTRRLHAGLDDAAGVSSRDASPEEAALSSETRLEIVALLDHLTPDQRQVVELRLAGLDGYEIADALGRSRASVDTAQSRAVSRLRKLLGVTPAPSRTEGHHAEA